MAAIGRDLHRRGYEILLFDLRGHGMSDPARLSMGRREREDLRAVLAWAGSEGYPARPDRLARPLARGLDPADGGGAEPRHPGRRRRQPVRRPARAAHAQLPLHSHLPSWFNPGILFRRPPGLRRPDRRPRADPLGPAWGRRPLLLIHGEADSIVPVRQARRWSPAVGPGCEAVLLPGVEHVRAFRADPAAYVSGSTGSSRSTYPNEPTAGPPRSAEVAEVHQPLLDEPLFLLRVLERRRCGAWTARRRVLADRRRCGRGRAGAALDVGGDRQAEEAEDGRHDVDQVGLQGPPGRRRRGRGGRRSPRGGGCRGDWGRPRPRRGRGRAWCGPSRARRAGRSGRGSPLGPGRRRRPRPCR